MKRELFVIAGILLISSMVFATGRQQAQTTGTAANTRSPITISVFHETGGHPQPNRNNPIYEYIQRELGVTFTWDILVGDIAQRRATMIAGGRYPDIIEIRGNEWIDEGALINLEPLINQYGPRIKEHYKDVWERMRSADGGVYYLINFHVYTGLDQNPTYDGPAFWIQKDILAKAGYPQVRTLDQYFGLIRDYYRANPTINGQPAIPFTILMDDWRAFELWNPPNFLGGNPNDGNGAVSMPGYVYKAFFTEDVSKRWFQYLNGLYNEGLIDREFATQTYDQYTAKISSGRVLGQSVQGWQFMYSADMANRDRGENNRTQAPFPVVFDNTIKPWYRSWPTPNYLRGMGISKSVTQDRAIRIIQFINDFLSEDVQRTVNWGIEGLHWQYNERGIPYRDEQQRANWNNDNWQTLNRGRLLSDIFPKIQGSFSDGYPSDLSHLMSERIATMYPEDIALLNAYKVESTNALMDVNPPPNNIWFPTWSMEFATPPSGSPAQLALARLEETMKTRLPALIMAPAAQFETLWTQYVQAMNTAGLATYNQHMQQELDRTLRLLGVTVPRR
ncbi:MAG: extracellular solute-binding protein [Treponema sp.]|nr:extracellular solute-binding protein [Treponema sp.]